MWGLRGILASLLQPKGAQEGLLEPGNIDLNNRPVVENPDGSISTIRSMSVGFDDGTYLIPTISDNGDILSSEDAIRLSQSTGRHLGKFANPEAADRFAQELSNLQGARNPALPLWRWQ